MEESPPKLTISITTRNRAGFIGQTLDSIAPQLTDETELLIVDGASTDDTPLIVEDYCRRIPSLRYLRRDELYGPDRDFSYSVEQSRGTYCWLMTDDDLLSPNAVAAVLRALQSEPSLVIVNAEVRNADLTKLLESRRLPFLEDQTFTTNEWERLFVKTASYLSFIGAVVVRRSVWMARDRERYFGSLFVHVGVLFQRPLPQHAIVLARPMISIRYGNAQWRSRQFEVWMILWPQLIWSFEGLSRTARQAISPRKPWRNIIRLLLYRAKGAFSRAEYQTYLRPRSQNIWERAAPLCVSFVPGHLANLLALLACLLSSRRPGRGKAGRDLRLTDLRNSPSYCGKWLAFSRRQPVRS